MFFFRKLFRRISSESVHIAAKRARVRDAAPSSSAARSLPLCVSVCVSVGPCWSTVDEINIEIEQQHSSRSLYPRAMDLISLQQSRYPTSYKAWAILWSFFWGSKSSPTVKTYFLFLEVPSLPPSDLLKTQYQLTLCLVCSAFQQQQTSAVWIFSSGLCFGLQHCHQWLQYDYNDDGLVITSSDKQLQLQFSVFPLPLSLSLWSPLKRCFGFTSRSDWLSPI